MAADAEVMEPLSKSDRNELRRVVKGRFELLREEIGQRAQELHRLIKRRINDEASKDIAKAEKEGEKIAKEFRRIGEKAANLRQEMAAKGLIACTEYEDENLVKHLESFITTHLTGWKVKDLRERVEAEVEEIQREHGVITLNLRGQELSLLEDISVDALETPKAKELLARIPDIDTLIPLEAANAPKAISA